MTLTELVIKLSSVQQAGDPKLVEIVTENSKGEQVHLEVEGIFEHKLATGKVFIKAKPAGL